MPFFLIACTTPNTPDPTVEPPVPIDRQPDLPATPTTATYFVSLDGDNSNDGTEENPFRTIEKALDTASAGDTIFVKAGRYREDKLRLIKSGTANARITLMASPNENVTIDWSGKSEGGMVLQGADYIVLRNLSLINSPQQCLFLGNQANHNVFVHLRLENCFGSGFQIFEGSNNIIAYSHAKNNVDNARNADGFGSIGQGRNSISKANEFWYNTAEGNGDDGFDTWKAINSLLYGNISFNNGKKGGDGNGFKLGGESNNASGTIIRNIAYNNSSNGFDTNTGGGNEIYNNTAWNNGSRNFISTQAPSTNIFRNNLSYQGEIGMFDSFNDNFNSWKPDIGDPKFISTNPRDPTFLKLSANSPAIDKGKNVGLPFNGSAPDLGALEFVN